MTMSLVGKFAQGQKNNELATINFMNNIDTDSMWSSIKEQELV